MVKFYEECKKSHLRDITVIFPCVILEINKAAAPVGAYIRHEIDIDITKCISLGRCGIPEQLVAHSMHLSFCLSECTRAQSYSRNHASRISKDEKQ